MDLNYENPNLCEQGIRDAFSQHFQALNQPDRPVEIYRSFYAAFDAAWEVMFFDSTWQGAINAGWNAACDGAQEAAREAAREAATAATSDAVLEVARKVAFDEGLKAAKKGTFDTARDVPDLGWVQVVRKAAFKTVKQMVSLLFNGRTGKATIFGAEWRFPRNTDQFCLRTGDRNRTDPSVENDLSEYESYSRFAGST